MNPSSTFGNHLRLTVRGASHAPRLTFALANFPAAFAIDRAELKAFMERRAPGRDAFSTARHEPDEVVFDAGVSPVEQASSPAQLRVVKLPLQRRRGRLLYEHGSSVPPSPVEQASRLLTTGETIRGHIDNTNIRPADYGSERTVPRPGHADFPQWVEAGRIPTGGGANSGRLTAALCAAGGLCKQFLARRGITVSARIESIHGRKNRTEEEILKAKAALDSVGGTVVCEAKGLPPGIGGALFGGIETELAGALFAVPGLKGVEFGNGFACCNLTGSENDDPFVIENGQVKAPTNRQGGILGGRTSGMPVTFRVALRPTPTVFKSLRSVDLATMTPADLAMKGRHDPCIVRRAVPVIEAVTAFALADAILSDEAAHPRICLTLTGKTLAESLAQFAAERYFTDLVELRVDLLTKAERAKAAEFPALLAAMNDWHVPTILTFRRACDGGAFSGSEGERLAFFRRLFAASPAVPFAYVDFEEDFGDRALVDAAHAAGAKVIRSVHDFKGPVRNLAARLKKLRKTGDIAKVAFMPRTAADVTRLFRTLAGEAGPHVVCAMGPLGLPSRVLAGRLGSLWTYASTGALGAIGHLSPKALVRDYRFRSVSKAAKVVRVKAAEVALANARFLAEDEDSVALPR